MRRTFGYLGTLALAATGAVFATAAPASAATAHGCVYPRVCFYQNNTTYGNNDSWAAYRDFGYQNLGALGRASKVVFNSRNDDGARIYVADAAGNPTGNYACIRPNQAQQLLFRPAAIEIRDREDCL